MRVAALILAGGMSQRMGQDKAFLPIRGVSLLRRTWDVARSLTPDLWVVTAWGDRYRSLLPEDARWLAELPPPAGRPPAGPLIAFAQALPQVMTQCEPEWVLLLACDLPALQALVLQQWAQKLASVSDTAIAYLPRTEKGWEPLCGFYHVRCLAGLQPYIASGGRAFQTWLNHHEVVEISDVPREMLQNCNTPEDWRTAIEAEL